MSRLLAGAAAAALALLTLAAPSAQACTPSPAPAPLPLVSESFGVSALPPPAGDPVVCDGLNYVFCGDVGVTLRLSGVSSRQRPGPNDYPWPLSTVGSVDLTRVYGCATAGGRRLHRYDTRVVQRGVALYNRRNIPYPVPTTDILEVAGYALLTDGQPGNCPTGTHAMLYRMRATHAELTLESQWTAIPASTTYRIHGTAVWNGAVPTPTV